MTPDFFGVFQRLADRLDNVQIESYYGPIMTDFTRDSAWEQIWDIASLREHVPHVPEAFVVDLGTGDGRLIKRLTDVGVRAEFLGIDSSEAAGRQFRRRQEEHGFPGVFRQGDFLSDGCAGRPADAAMFGSVSINGLHTIELLSRLFAAGNRLLRPTAPLVLSVYSDEATGSFPDLDGVLDVTPYMTAQGAVRLMWRGLRYTGTAFCHNAFVDRSAEGLPSVLCWERERVWSESELLHIAGALGWWPRHRSVASVEDGGAEGLDVITLSFIRGA